MLRREKNKDVRIFRIDQADPDPAIVTEIAGALKSGAVIAFPTDTFYGLGADIYNVRAVKKVFNIKGRGYDKPVLVLISDPKDIPSLILDEKMSTYTGRLMDQFWPGPLTIVFYAAKSIPEVLTGGTGKIGIRLPDHPFCRRLVERMGSPITATSANISGMPSLKRPEEVLRSIGDRIDALVDGGVTAGGAESTVVDVTGPEPCILREGAIPASVIEEVLSGERS